MNKFKIVCSYDGYTTFLAFRVLYPFIFSANEGGLIGMDVANGFNSPQSVLLHTMPPYSNAYSADFPSTRENSAFLAPVEFHKSGPEKPRLFRPMSETPAISKFNYLRIDRAFSLKMACIAAFRTSMMKPSLCRFASTVNSAIFQKYGNPVNVLR